MERFAEADKVLAGFFGEGGPSIAFGGDRAYYAPSLDAVRLHEPSSFKGSAEFYSTAFHEAGHATGHERRLARLEGEALGSFGSAPYSREELVAAFTAVFVCSVLSISTESAFRNSVGYVQGWLKAIKDEPGVVIQAASRAQKAADWVLGVERTPASAATSDKEAAVAA